MKVRDRLSYSNVAATAALTIALGTGGAYAAGELGSRDIDDNSLRSVDLRNERAVTGRDVRPNSLTGRDVRESSLRASRFLPTVDGHGGVCNPVNSTFVDCVTATVRLRAPGRVLVVATGEYFSEGGPAGLTCRVAVDGANLPIGASPGETVDTTDLAQTQGFATTDMTPRMARGRHELALRCQEALPGDGRLASSSIAVLGISK